MLQKSDVLRVLYHFILIGLLAGCSSLPSMTEESGEKAPLPSNREIKRPDPRASKEAMLRRMDEADSDARDQLSRPSPSPPTKPSPTDQIQKVTQKSDCQSQRVPEWITNEPAVGVSDQSREQAESQAREQAIKNLEVELTSDFKSFEGETTGGKYAYSLESVIVEKVDISIAGLEITKVFVDECTGKYYALAAIDGSKAINAWNHDLREVDSRVEALRQEVAESEKKGTFFEKLLALFRLVQEEELGEKIEKRLAYLTKKPVPGNLRSGIVMRELTQYESLLRSLLVKGSGDQQQAVEEPRLPGPLVVQVLAGKAPLSHVPVNFIVQEGSIEIVPATARTDQEGTVKVKGRYAAETQKPDHIIAQVDLDQITQGFPPELKKQLFRRAEQLTYEFQTLPPVYYLVRSSKELTAEAAIIKKDADNLLKGDDPIEALIALHRLMNIQESWKRNAKQLKTLYDPIKAEKYLPSVGDPVQTQRQYDEIIDSLTLRAKAGNGQEAQFERPLKDPLVAQIIANLPTREIPIRGLPVQFGFETGAGKIEPRTMTNSEGLAQTTVSRVEPGQSPATIVASIAWEQMSDDIPDRIQTDLKIKLRGVKFSITPPWGCQTDDPFVDGLYKVACELAGQVNDSAGQGTIVGEFIWSKTRKRTPLSHRMEQSVAKGLALSGSLKVIQRDGVSARGIAPDVKAVVSGEYGLDKEKGLWVDAILRRKDSDEIESVLPEKQFIPRSALPKEGLALLEETQETGQTAAPVPAPRSEQTFDDWVEQFWHIDNPDANFTIDLTPDRPAYRVGEKAVFRFRTTRDCYLTLVNIGTSGKWIMLLPNWEQSDINKTLVKAGSERVIPTADDPFEFEIAEPLGVERIKAICTTKPVPIVQGVDLSNGFFSLSSEAPRWRDIRPIAKEKAEETPDWSTANAQINTLRAGQKELPGQTIMRSRGILIED